MRVRSLLGHLIIVATLTLRVWTCSPEEEQNGCKIYGSSCTCGFGCRSEYIYRTRRECSIALRQRSNTQRIAPTKRPSVTLNEEKSPNICSRIPCQSGVCIQTAQDPSGYTCKCDSTGFYGKRCEKACPTIPMRGLVFPHECVVI